MKLTVYGSFNCPYSFLASLRVERLSRLGVADVDWRAVVHDPAVPSGGLPVAGELAGMLDRELDEIRGQLQVGEPYPATRPRLQPNTTIAVAGHSTAIGADADRLRVALFDAYWVKGLDLGDTSVLDELDCPTASSGATMHRWRDEWLGFERPMVPMIVLPDGTVSRGLGALKRLADLGTDDRAGR
jgi:2-hydroxychromene-2-carboxylate isomerase